LDTVNRKNLWLKLGWAIRWLEYLSHAFYPTQENAYFRSSMTFWVSGVMLDARERKMSGMNVGLTQA